LQAGGRRFDPVQLHQVQASEIRDQGSEAIQYIYRLWLHAAFNFGLGSQRAKLRAAVFFNNSEGKGSHDLMRVV
jgi:hypothetical protein